MSNILITGGSGFLGRGIMRRAERDNWNAKFTVYSRDEQKQDKCKQRFPDTNYVLGDITDVDRLTTVMLGHDIVIHAAALKYIPEGELNVSECTRVNIGGAQAVVRAAYAASIEKVIGISTDKAVCPVNVYGLSKAIMERIFGEAAQRGKTKYVCCRYGNVVGSTGSVIPLFKRQLHKTGRVTVTDPTMTRFWISVDEAVDLITMSLDDCVRPGAVVIPEPRSMKIGDLAMTLAGDPSKVDIVGLRPGEKMHEDLLNSQEVTRTIIRDSHYELLPPGHRYNLTEVPSTLCSSTPKAWVTPVEMLEMIADAERV